MTTRCTDKFVDPHKINKHYIVSLSLHVSLLMLAMSSPLQTEPTAKTEPSNVDAIVASPGMAENNDEVAHSSKNGVILDDDTPHGDQEVNKSTKARKTGKKSKAQKDGKKIVCMRGKCKHQQLEFGDMVRCSMCMEWHHNDCVDAKEIGSPWNCSGCRSLPTTVNQLQSDMQDIKHMLREALDLVLSQSEEINKLNNAVLELKTQNAELVAENLIMTENEKHREKAKLQAVEERKAMLQELINLKVDQGRQTEGNHDREDKDVSSNSTPTKEQEFESTVTPKEVNICSKQSVSENSTNDQWSPEPTSGSWKFGKAIPKSVATSQTVVIGSSVLKGLSPRRLSESVGHQCCIDTLRGATVSEIAARIPAVLNAASHVQTVVLFLGGNDIGKKPVHQMIQEYEDILESFKPYPAIKPVVCSILPRKNPQNFNSHLRDSNHMLKQMCQRRRCEYLDLTSSFPLSSCDIFLAEDGVHLSRNGVHQLGRCLARKLADNGGALRNDRRQPPMTQPWELPLPPSQSRWHPSRPTPHQEQLGPPYFPQPAQPLWPSSHFIPPGYTQPWHSFPYMSWNMPYQQ